MQTTRQSTPSPLPFGGLPPSELERPAIISWRLSHLEERVSLLEARRHWHRPQFSRLPWAQLLGVAVLIALGLMGHLTKSDVLNIARKLLGF